MAAEESQMATPDLASVLKTLASLAPHNSQLAGQHPIPQQTIPCLGQPQPQHYNPEHQPSQQQWEARSEQRSTTPPFPPPNQTPPVHHHFPQQYGQPSQQLQNFRAPPRQVKNVVDPSTIIEWSAGLRCMLKTVAKNENIIQEIKRMIKVQHEHEEQWWNGRKALQERLAARKEGKKKLDEILKAVRGSVAPGVSEDSPEALAKELETFDMKVYKAQMQMVREMNSRLRNLGVPFFGTRTDLVRPVGKEAPPPPATGVEGPKDGKVVIDEVELVKLQRKMLAMLEDLCCD